MEGSRICADKGRKKKQRNEINMDGPGVSKQNYSRVSKRQT